MLKQCFVSHAHIYWRFPWTNLEHARTQCYTLFASSFDDSYLGSVRKESLRNHISSWHDTSFCFCVGKCSFKTDSLWKSKSLVSKVVLFWNLRHKLVEIESIQDRFSRFLKLVFCLTRFFKLYAFKEFDIVFSLWLFWFITVSNPFVFY